MCLYPRLIDNPKFRKNKKNKGKIPACKDIRTKAVPIACGRCIECRKAKSREWQARLCEELRTNPTRHFMTMTFSEGSLQKLSERGKKAENETAAKAIELFRKRWHKEYGKSIKHWLVTELGHENTNRLHLHGFLWTTENLETIERIWGYGWCDNGDYVDEQSINYCVKYVTKIDKDHPDFQSRIFCSPGIGKTYTERWDKHLHEFREGATNETYRTPRGTKINLPMYWRNKLFNEDEREQLWINKLNSKIRWVRGEKIDISTKEGEIEYFEALKFRQAENERLGYPAQPWSKKKYKKNRKKFGI